MKSILQKFLVTVILASVAVSSGWHLMLLQTFGWSRMLIAYSQYMPASQALDLTFKGVELCGVCEFVAAQKQQMEEAWQFWLDARVLLLMMVVATFTILRPKSEPWCYPGVALVYCGFKSPPESPPPRSATAKLLTISAAEA